jgi:Rhodopirellula transposase DDE domain
VSIQLTDSLKNLLKETSQQLKGAAKRRFIAQTVVALGYGVQSKAERELGWNRVTIGKGIKELKTGITCVDNYRGRGRKKAEEILPNLLEDLKKLVDSQSQIDPTFKSQRLYTRLSAAQVRQQLIENFGYSDEELPTPETIRVKLNDLGYRLKRVAKIQPQKKFPKLMQSLSN